jgi:hypothetical protein
LPKRTSFSGRVSGGNQPPPGYGNYPSGRQPHQFPEKGLFLQFIDKLSYPTLIIVALLMVAAPFVPEPHLVEKVRMLMDGTLTKPLDMFDVVGICCRQSCSA